ncbi:DUF1670 domain-containing protein [Desulfofundulus sp. TPOSR]|uniref:DUF1670 domain-containing protein n=1 Tax=Desulfofundulus sp. TPOSR TaxID=2714340 RepID=UPI0014083525|nr:DUF1670 domain-containing protein [Desulfofundulus sp. TPOSR]NHM28683.1 DUF1670 domain-containing protein [Desulfofundulus sp. TPOSR]
MGRPRFHRQNLLAQTNSVEQKCLFHWLVRESMDRFGLSFEEARSVAAKGLDFLNQETDRMINQIVFPLISAEYAHQREKYSLLPKRPVVLTPFMPDDLEIHREFGLKAMQNARLLRLIEEAYLQGVVFDQPHLSLLTNITAKSIRERLKPLWEKGVCLPLAGQALKHRRNRVFRSTFALQMAISGERPSRIREELFISESQWESWQLDFSRVAALAGKELNREHIARVAGVHPRLVDEYLELAKRAPRGYLSRLKVSLGLLSDPHEEEDPAARLFHVLQAEHNFSPAKARAFLRLLENHLEEHRDNRPPGSVVYYAVSDQEPPGKPLDECRLVPVKLSFYSPEDEEKLNPDTTSQLKWQRILRYTGEAKAQGACLGQPDLAFLLGVHPSVIQRLMSENRQVFVPTRGNLADMGPGISHMSKIVELYLQGYTETQIKHRTGHSYESIEAYLKTFATYVGLCERGLPLPLIRKVMHRSARVVKTCAALYERFNQPEYQWVLTRIRQIFAREQAVKKGMVP